MNKYQQELEMTRAEINKLTPDEFLEMIHSDIEDKESNIFNYSLEESTENQISINGMNLIAVPETSIDSGYELPSLEYIYNLKEIGCIEMSGLSSTLYQKLDESKPAFVVYGWCNEVQLYKFN